MRGGQVMYGDGTPLTQPKDEGVDVTSAEPEKALQEAQCFMDILWPTLDDEEFDLANRVCDWKMDYAMQQASTIPQLTEANVEAHDFRLEFAAETLQSFKRDRSRSPCQNTVDKSFKRDRSRSPRRNAVDDMQKIADGLRGKTSEQAIEIAELQCKIMEKDRQIDYLTIQLRGSEERSAIKQATVDSILGMLAQEVQRQRLQDESRVI